MRTKKQAPQLQPQSPGFLRRSEPQAVQGYGAQPLLQLQRAIGNQGIQQLFQTPGVQTEYGGQEARARETLAPHISPSPLQRLQRLINRDASQACDARRVLPICDVQAGPIDPLIVVYSDAFRTPDGARTIAVEVTGQAVGRAGQPGAGQPVPLAYPSFNVSLWRCGAFNTPLGPGESSGLSHTVAFQRTIPTDLPADVLGVEGKVFYLRIDNRSLDPLLVTVRVTTNTASCP